ncbi:hypothetical protein [Nocardia caishijiensis]|uniref:hypothetical protein n=1 Tax=Nocardia caishijiensis TaxID=184756 RepID=UPI001F2C9226|nr:hypothetical protein [Nocardia caishijiensis]
MTNFEDRPGVRVNSLDGCLKRIMDIPGACGVTLVDGASGLAVAAVGAHDIVDEHEDAAGTTDVMRTVLACSALTSAAADDEVRELIVCRDTGFHLLHLLDGDFEGRLFVHAVFDGAAANLGMARYQLKVALKELAGR